MAGRRNLEDAIPGILVGISRIYSKLSKTSLSGFIIHLLVP